MKTLAVLCIKFTLFLGFTVLVFYLGRESFRDDWRKQKSQWVSEVQSHHRDTSQTARKMDYMYRVAIMEEFNRSLTAYGQDIDDPLFDEFVGMAKNARVLSIYEADTMGISKKPGSRLSVIPLTPDEYLLYRGGRDKRTGCYDQDSRMIILWLDKSYSEIDVASQVYLHELGHDYFTVHGIDASTEFQHSWIAHMQSRFKQQLAKKRGKNLNHMFDEEVLCDMSWKNLPSGDDPSIPQQKLPSPALHEEQWILKIC